MAKVASSTPKNIPGASKFKLPSAKTGAIKAPQIPTTGLKGYMNASKMMVAAKPPKNGLAQFNQ